MMAEGRKESRKRRQEERGRKPLEIQTPVDDRKRPRIIFLLRRGGGKRRGEEEKRRAKERVRADIRVVRGSSFEKASGAPLQSCTLGLAPQMGSLAWRSCQSARQKLWILHELNQAICAMVRAAGEQGEDGSRAAGQVSHCREGQLGAQVGGAGSFQSSSISS
jgi:hypothetical protein